MFDKGGHYLLLQCIAPLLALLSLLLSALLLQGYNYRPGSLLALGYTHTHTHTYRTFRLHKSFVAFLKMLDFFSL